MRAFTGVVNLNNGKFDRSYGFRVYGSVPHAAASRAIQTAVREFRKTHREQIHHYSVPRLTPSAVFKKDDPATAHITSANAKRYAKAWLVGGGEGHE